MKPPLWWAGLFAVLGCVLYAPAAGAGFAGDDFIWLYDAAQFRSPADLFGPHYFRFVRPVSNLFFWIGGRLWGLNPIGYHLLALALHVATAVMLLFWIRRVTRDTLAGAVAGLSFLAYPHHWESVCWSAAVGEVLAGFFMVACMLSQAGPRWIGLVLAVAAMMSKESALVLPILIWLWSRMTRDQRSVVPYGAAAALVLGWEVLLVATRAHDLGRRLDVIAGNHWHVFSEAFWGPWLSYPAVFRLEAGTGWLWPVVTAFGLVAYAAAAWRAWRQAPPLAFGLLWVPVTVLPYAVLVPTAQPYERYAYLPSIGVAACIGWAAVWSWPRLPKAGVALLLAVLLAGNAANLEGRVTRFARSVVPITGTPAASQGTVYLYEPPYHEAYMRRALALYAPLPLERIHGWYEMFARGALGPGDVALFWDESAHSFLDLSDKVHLPDTRYRIGVPPESVLRPLPVADTWPLESDRAYASPDLDVPPVVIYSVEVRYTGGASELTLAWDSGPQDRLTLSVGPGTHAVTFFPSSRPSWWTQDRVHRLYLSAPPGLQIQSIRLSGFRSDTQ